VGTLWGRKQPGHQVRARFALPAGAVENKRAVNGVLVTTSWATKSSRDLAARPGRIEIIGGRQPRESDGHAGKAPTGGDAAGGKPGQTARGFLPERARS
jgi:hypothetical protein